MDGKRLGGRQCGAVRYEVRGKPLYETWCHCTFCRRASAAPAVAWFSVAPEAFNSTQSEPIWRSSPIFGQWVGLELSGDNLRQLWVPEGFVHDFLVVSDSAEFLYKIADCCAPEHERAIRWDDPELGIRLPDTGGEPQLSAKDRQASTLGKAELFA